jgi:hypothetical protein
MMPPGYVYILQFYNLLHTYMDSYFFTVVDKKLILAHSTLFHVQNQGVPYKYTVISNNPPTQKKKSWDIILLVLSALLKTQFGLH